jgi:hypothetical protein
VPLSEPEESSVLWLPIRSTLKLPVALANRPVPSVMVAFSTIVTMPSATIRLQQTRTDSRRMRAQSRATRFSLNAPGIARFCECGSLDVYSTLITPQVTYRRCRRCGNIWPWDAGDEPEQEGL